MLDNERDSIIKKEIQKDKYISKQANDVFQNFYKMNSYEASIQEEKISQEKDTNDILKNNEEFIINNRTPFRWKAIITIAASFVMVFSAGIAVYINKDNLNNYNSNTIASEEPLKISTANIIGGKNAADYKSIVVKNNEIIVSENNILKSSQNDMIKAVLTKDGKVAISLKQGFMNAYKLNLDASKYYSVRGINKAVKDVFVGYMLNSYTPYVLLLMSDSSVEYVQIINGNISANDNDTFEFDFFDQGQIMGLTDIIKFEQKSDTKLGAGEPYYYIVAINSKGVQKEIELGKYNDMTEVFANKVPFTSQDGKSTYYIDANEGNYIQSTGWAGASNNVYYISNKNLYHMSLVDGRKTKLVEGVTKIWQDEINGDIVVKLDNTYTIVNEDNHITLEESTISQADIIDTKEDDNMIAYLHKDGCITIMFKSGGIRRITEKSNNAIKENVKYNFSFKELLYKYPNQEFKATAIYVGKIGAKKEECLAFGTSYNVFKMFDVAYYLEKANQSNFEIESEALSMNLIDRKDDFDGKIVSIEQVNEKIRLLDDNSIVDCVTLKWNLENGSSETYPSIALMLKEGFHDENGIGRMEVVD